ncbi:MAG TPA: hypothetical protein VFR96_04470 [Povalibacter sp.]|jgi:hypothetical protein|nr:hypothetical protein [Povalibacter sp.]
MAHVTFVHGIANKPPAEDLLRVWRRALADAAEPLPLGDLGVTTSLVYWADLMYEKPQDDASAEEATGEALLDASGSAEQPQPANAEEAAFIAAVRAKLTALSAAQMTAAELPGTTSGAQGTFERVPLPWFIKKRIMDIFLRDVHHYLFDTEFAPPGRTPVHIQQTIRQRFVDAVCGQSVSRPHIVVSHSMGTVIAYDCLKRVAACANVDGLITIGSPLGLDEIQDKLHPEWTRANGFPRERVAADWINLYDRLDPVCGFDPALANDYRERDTGVVKDIPVENDGAWRHSATKYLRQPAFRRSLRGMLGL